MVTTYKDSRLYFNDLSIHQKNELFKINIYYRLHSISEY